MQPKFIPLPHVAPGLALALHSKPQSGGQRQLKRNSNLYLNLSKHCKRDPVQTLQTLKNPFPLFSPFSRASHPPNLKTLTLVLLLGQFSCSPHPSLPE